MLLVDALSSHFSTIDSLCALVSVCCVFRCSDGVPWTAESLAMNVARIPLTTFNMPCVSDTHPGHQIASPATMLTRGFASEMEHATLLCSLFLGNAIERHIFCSVFCSFIFRSFVSFCIRAFAVGGCAFECREAHVAVNRVTNLFEFILLWKFPDQMRSNEWKSIPDAIERYFHCQMS